MPDPTPTPDPIPIPVPIKVTPPWASAVMVILTALASFLSGLHVGPTPTPTPQPIPIPQPIPTPTPTPVPDPQPAPQPIPVPDPQPAPQPIPVPIPQPTPQPQPIPVPPTPLPVVISVTDTAGNPLPYAIEAGKLFFVSVSQGYEVIGIPQPDSAGAEVGEVSPGKLVCTLKIGGKIQIIAYGIGKPTLMMVTCNTAPQPAPQPIPVPIPQPTPQPQPIPQSRKLSIAVVRNALTMTNLEASIYNDMGTWNGFQAKGHKVRIYNQTDVTLPAMAAKNIAQVNGIQPPSLIICDLTTGDLIKAVPLPGSTPEIQSLVTALGG